MNQKQQKNNGTSLTDELVSTLISISVVSKSLAKRVMVESVKEEHLKGGEEDE